MPRPKRRNVAFADPPLSPATVTHQPEPLQTLQLRTGTWHDVPPRPGGKEGGEEQEDEQELRNVPIPTNIHLDLQRAGIITDPHRGTAERDCQWVHERAWRMTTEFYVTLASLLPKRRACLVLEGLDTFATVRVNGTKVLKSSNMFLSHRVDVTDRVNLMGKQNVVEIVFESAMEMGRRLLRRHRGVRACWNGHYERVFIRKAQYHFGWDWGPSLVTAGPWKPVSVEVYSARLETVEAVVKVKENLKRASLVLSAMVEAVGTDAEFAVTVEVVSPAGKRFDIDLKLKDGMYVAEVDIPKPELWYPRNYGEQNIYNAAYTLTTPSAPEALHIVTKRFGFRRVELVRDLVPDEPGNELSGGSTFYFCINNVPIFCGGSNWVPADSFQPRITKDQLKHLLKDLLAERGNQNMIRVWGGGVYESEDFYDICDEAGILVWQDLCFASADYPSNLNWFVESVEAEVRQNMQRLKWHPSLVIVVGNSGDYQVQEEEIGDLPDVPEDDYSKGPFPSRWLYEILFPDILGVVYNFNLGLYPGTGTSGVVYWYGSPFSGEDCTDRTMGDIHQWNVWGGIQAPYQRYPDLGGRFVSEFGMPSHPALPTVTNGIIDPSSPNYNRVSDEHPQSFSVVHHIKAHSFEKRMLPYVFENLRHNPSPSMTYLEQEVLLTQLVQAEALSYAYRGWRRKWGSRLCGGALVWQLNDVWPCTSWAIVDYYRRPKLGFYAISRAMRPLILITRRLTSDPKPNPKVEALVQSKSSKIREAKLHSTPHVYPEKKSNVEVAVSSIELEGRSQLRVVVEYVSVATGKKRTVFDEGELKVAGNATVELFDEPVPEEEATVVFARLFCGEELVDMVSDWPQPLKFVDLSTEAKIEISVADVHEEEEEEEEGKSVAVVISVNTDRPVKSLVFEERDGERWTDNCVDVMPGQVYTITVSDVQLQAEEAWEPKGWSRYGMW